MLTGRRGWWVLSGVVVLAGAVALPALAAPEALGSRNATTTRVYVAGGHMMVPLGEVLQQLPGSTSEWVPEFLRVVVRHGDQVIRLHPGSGYAHLRGQGIVLDSPAVIHGQRLMVPARFFRLLSGVTVSYDRANGSALIRSDAPGAMTLGYRSAQGAVDVTTEGVVVRIGDVDTITVCSGGSHPSLAARVRAITARLNHAIGAVESRGGFASEQVRLSQSRRAPTVYVGTEAVVEVGGEDARLASTSREQLGDRWVRELRHALAQADRTGAR